MREASPLGALARGVVAGAAGTVAMTGYQTLVQRLQSGDADGVDDQGGQQGDPWESAPAPAQVARRILKGVFRVDVSPVRIPLLTSVMHWLYGTTWGGVYGLVEGSIGARPLAAGLTLGTGVWASSYAELVPMGIYEPPWKYSRGELATDLSYHLVYGVATAAAFESLRP